MNKISTIQESNYREFVSQIEETFPYLDQKMRKTIASIFINQFDNQEKFVKKINKLTIDLEIKENILTIAYKLFSSRKLESEANDNKRKRDDEEDKLNKRQCLKASFEENKKRKGDKLENEKNKKIFLEEKQMFVEVESTSSKPLYIEELIQQRHPDIILLAFTRE